MADEIPIRDKIPLRSEPAPTPSRPLNVPLLERPARLEVEPLQPDRRSGVVGIVGVLLGVGLLSPCLGGVLLWVGPAIAIAYYAAIALYFAGVYWVNKTSTDGIWMVSLRMSILFIVLGAVGLLGGGWTMMAQAVGLIILPPSVARAYQWYNSVWGTRCLRRIEREQRCAAKNKSAADREQALRDLQLPPRDNPDGPLL